jgi:hypothetical protein
MFCAICIRKALAWAIISHLKTLNLSTHCNVITYASEIQEYDAKVRGGGATSFWGTLQPSMAWVG